jgi:ABC-2 type transport system permease protein
VNVPRFSPARMGAMILKEFIQMKRDRLTFAMMVGIPIIQLMLFGYAINADPRQLPTAVLGYENGPASRAIVVALQNSTYFRVTVLAHDTAEVDRLLDRGQVQFAVEIPTTFERDFLRGERPALLIMADATDPAATGPSVGALQIIVDNALAPLLNGTLSGLAPGASAAEVRIHRRYNPEGITLTMIIMTALAMTRERERGTMENLLAMPVRPIEVMVGKLTPFIAVGMVQVGVILTAARLLFHVPMMGNPAVLATGLLVFIVANLAVGFLFSTVAKNQLQAMQMSFFFFLPSILMSGFMFPFRGMPGWAQVIGEGLPLTHFLRVVRGVMLKGIGIADAWTDVWPMLAFLLAVSVLAMLRYRQTLD